MKQTTKKTATPGKKKQEADAKKDLLQELFYDLYQNRWSVYRMNFLRGLFFGLGSVLGGTVVIALLVWILSLLANVVPGLREFFDAISALLESAKKA